MSKSGSPLIIKPWFQQPAFPLPARPAESNFLYTQGSNLLILICRLAVVRSHRTLADRLNVRILEGARRTAVTGGGDKSNGGSAHRRNGDWGRCGSPRCWRA